MAKRVPQFIAALAAAGGALCAGTVLGWSSPVQKEIEDGSMGFDVSRDNFSWLGSYLTLGAALTCIPVGSVINTIGRKITMLLMVIPFVIGWGLLIFPTHVVMMYVGRFLLGVCCGAICVSAPLYTCEIAQKDIRGTLGTFFQLLITIGILFVYVVGALLDPKNTSIVCSILPIIVFIVLIFMPESPVFLIKKNKNEKAAAAMEWLRGKEFDASAELNEIRAVEKAIQDNPVSIINGLKRKETIKALIISLGLMLLQQFCGINAVIFYQTDIFDDANTGLDPGVATIIVGTVQVIATYISVMTVDKVGRRILLTLSSGVMAISTLSLGFYFFLKNNDEESVENLTWLPVVALCLFIIMFSLGLGPVPWLIMGEVFASDVKGVCCSIAGTTNWAAAFVVTKTFSLLSDLLGTGPTFWIFSAVSIGGVFFVILVVPETKGKSLQEIQQELGA